MAKQKVVSQAKVEKKGRPWWQWGVIVFAGLWVVGIIGQTLGVIPDAQERSATQTATALVALATSQQGTAAAALTAAALPTATATAQPTATQTVGPTLTPTDEPPTNTPAPTATPVGYMRAEDYGDAWPLTVPDGIVSCEPVSRVLFTSGGKVYAINGTAMSQNKWLDIRDTIWRDNPTGLTPKVDINPVIELGLSLCNGTGNDTDSGSATIRPDNCSTAVAMGLSAQQAGQWSHLDRDGDGVACYGD